MADIKRSVELICAKFKAHLKSIHKDLEESLIPSHRHCVPMFYGIPKVHRNFKKVPPMRPIITQTAAPLSLSAKFIDHVLQPLAKSYPHYIPNSTSLIKLLQITFVRSDAILVIIAVTNLYQSIPQSKCLNTVYDEMFKKKHLLIADPNLVIQLLHTDPLLLVVSGSVPGQLQDLCREVLHHCGQVDGGAGTHSAPATTPSEWAPAPPSTWPQ